MATAALIMSLGFLLLLMDYNLFAINPRKY